MEGKVFQISFAKANYYYRCEVCNGIILKGEKYKRVKYSLERNTIKTVKVHEDCEVKEIVTFKQQP